MHMGQAMRFIRQSQGLGQDELGAKAGVSGGYISLIENGARDPSLEVVRKLCHAMGVSLTLLAMLSESDSPFVRPILPLAYVELSRLTKGEGSDGVHP